MPRNCSADPARQREIVKAYNRFVEKVISYELDRRAFEPTLLDVSTVTTPPALHVHQTYFC